MTIKLETLRLVINLEEHQLCGVLWLSGSMRPTCKREISSSIAIWPEFAVDADSWAKPSPTCAPRPRSKSGYLVGP